MPADQVLWWPDGPNRSPESCACMTRFPGKANARAFINAFDVRDAATSTQLVDEVTRGSCDVTSITSDCHTPSAESLPLNAL